MKLSATLLFVCCITNSAVLFATEMKTPGGDAKRNEKILTQSGWAQQAAAQFDLAADEEAPPTPPPAAAAAGLAGSGVQGAPRWDGSPARPDLTGTPTLNVLIRWDSAGPVREALKATGEAVPSDEEVAKDYVVTILGLVPANRYHPAGSTSSVSSSDGSRDPRDPEPTLEAFMTNSSIRVGERIIAPENVRVDPGGALHLYFPRTASIKLSDKDVTVNVRYGGMSISKRFRLKGMRYKGGLEL